METRKDRMAHPYIPQIDDYVVWRRTGGMIDKGWIYFVDEQYITIEVGVKDKPNCEYTREEKHKKIHTLVVCHPQFWHQLEYIKNRRPNGPNTNQTEYTI
jgi:hypothetical protein